MAAALFSPELLSAVEDAGLNATAVPQHRWIDGWLLRYAPGKARRSRCINALAPGHGPLALRLARAEAVYAQAGLPIHFRLTPFTAPVHAGGPELEPALAAAGYEAFDPTRVMVGTDLADLARAEHGSGRQALPEGLVSEPLEGAAFAAAVGALRRSSAEEIAGHAARLAASPVRHRGLALRQPDDGTVLACVQATSEAGLVGLYDVFVHASLRGRGMGRILCERLLAQEAALGGDVGYLQVDAANEAALRLYRRLGFRDAYGYCYARPRAASPPAIPARP